MKLFAICKAIYYDNARFSRQVASASGVSSRTRASDGVPVDASRRRKTAKRKPADMGSEEQTTREKDPSEAEVGEKPAKKKAKLSLAEALELLEKPAPKGNEGQTTRKKDSREEGPEVGEKPAKKKAKTSKMTNQKGASTSGSRTRSKAAKGGRGAKAVERNATINQLVREICAIEDKSAKLLERERDLIKKQRKNAKNPKNLEEQLRQVRLEEMRVEQNLFTKRKSLRAVVCDAREVENTQRLDKLPQEVWEKITDNLEDNDLFPLALSCRYFRQKQKELVVQAGQSGKPHRALKTVIRRKLGERQPASADYIRFCIKLKGKRRRDSDLVFWNRDFRQLAALHGHLPLLQELLKPLKKSKSESTKRVFSDVANDACEYLSSQFLLRLICFRF